MPRDNDALSLLKKDHEDVKKLFKEIEAEEDQEAIFQSDRRSPRGPRRDRRGDFLPSGQESSLRGGQRRGQESLRRT
jgi:hypothetical protein